MSKPKIPKALNQIADKVLAFRPARKRDRKPKPDPSPEKARESNI